MYSADKQYFDFIPSNIVEFRIFICVVSLEQNFTASFSNLYPFMLHFKNICNSKLELHKMAF